MKFHKDGSTPQNGETFVFGSNLAGIHGAGAAKEALKYGAVWGYGRGLVGNTVAIPTKDENIKTLPYEDVASYIGEMVEFMKAEKDLEFFITRVGCGLAGFKDEVIAPLFKECGDNCSLPDTWEPYL